MASRTVHARQAYSDSKQSMKKMRAAEIRNCEFNYIERNRILSDLGYNSYAEYLKSPVWQRLHDAMLNSRPQCECCLSPATQVHHRRYTVDSLTKVTCDLVPLCRYCHMHIEFKNGEKRFATNDKPKLEVKVPKPLPIPPVAPTKRQGTGSGLKDFVRSVKMAN